MRRRRLGRTLGLDVRIAFTLFVVALIYVGAIVIFAAVTVAAVWKADWVTAVSGVVFVFLLAFAAWNFVRQTSERALRTVSAKGLRPGEHPELDEMVGRLAAAADLPPPRLALALVKIAGREPRGDLRGGAAISAFCIVSTRNRRFELLSDHPPLGKRLKRLATIGREMGKPS